MTASFAEIAEQVQQLNLDEKEELCDLIHLWLIEQKREQFAKNASLAKAAYAEGTLKSGNLNDLMADLNGDD